MGHRNQVSWSGFFYFDTIFLELGFRSVLVNVSVKFVSVDRSYTFRIQIETFFSIIVINEISGTDRVISKRTFSQVRKCRKNIRLLLPYSAGSSFEALGSKFWGVRFVDTYPSILRRVFL